MKFLALLLLLASTVAAADTLKLDQTVTIQAPSDYFEKSFRVYVPKEYVYIVTVKARDWSVELEYGSLIGDADPAHNILTPFCAAELYPQVRYDLNGEPIPQLAVLVPSPCWTGREEKLIHLPKGWYTFTLYGYGPGRYTVNVRAVEDSQQ